ncbi:MAG: hypothetical protein M3442_00235 [Chloroflexota bacterium]|nr:hypothetical protein [Chloroflexota bacterium]
MARLQGIKRFYTALYRLRQRLGGYQSLSGESLPAIPVRGGIYFLFEPGEVRSHSGRSARVVRVGKAANLRARLYAHHGAASLRGPSVVGWHPHFHWYVQEALDSGRKHLKGAVGQSAGVTIKCMQFLWLPISDTQERERLETNSIRLLSNYGRTPIDPASPKWLGHRSPRPQVQQSHVWNVQNVKSHLRGLSHETALLERLYELADTADLT